jgi:hypothetical protein
VWSPAVVALATFALVTLALPTAWAQAPSQDTLRAGQVQVQADEAFRAGKLDEALRLASRAIGLDGGATTWLAQQIRVEVLEQQGRLEEAMTHLQEYLALEGLFPEHRAWGEEAEARIGAVLSDQQALADKAERARKGRLGAGVGLVVAGAIPLGIGVGFAANFSHNDSDVELYGGWLDAGLALIGVGVGVEVAGTILLLSAAPDRGGRRVTLRVASAGPGLRLEARW